MKDIIWNYVKENKYLLLAMVFLSIHLLYMSIDSYQMDYRAAFVAGRAFFDGVNPMVNNFIHGYQYVDANAISPFESSRFVYPPHSLFLYLPFCLTKSYFVSKLCFAIFNLICLFSLILFLKKLYPLRNEFVLLIMFSIPTWANFERGQIYVLVTLLLVLAYHYRNKIWAGLLAIIPAFLRLFPAVVLIYFLLRKHYKLLLSSIIWGIVFFIFGMVYFGPMAIVDFLSNLFQLMSPQSYSAQVDHNLITKTIAGIPRNDADMNLQFSYISNHLSYFKFSYVNFLKIIGYYLNLPFSSNIQVSAMLVALLTGFAAYIRKKDEKDVYFYIFMMFIILANSSSYTYSGLLYVPFAFYAASKFQNDFKMAVFFILQLFLPNCVQVGGTYLSMFLGSIAMIVYLIKENPDKQKNNL